MADEDPNQDRESLHQWAVTLVEDGRERRRAHEAQWWQNIATYTGDLWLLEGRAGGGLGRGVATNRRRGREWTAPVRHRSRSDRIRA